ILLTGGILGPVLLLVGLQRLSAVVGSLLLNLEAPFTILLAVGFFREHLGRREAGAILLILLGAGVMSYEPGALHFDWVGAGAIAAACMSWAIDNNLTQRLSLRDPIAIVRVKTLGAGACILSVAMALGDHWPEPRIVGYALVLGFLSYGVSVVLDLYALRLLGAAREAAFFATAPFIGAVAAVPLLGERWTGSAMLAAIIMAVGVFLLLSEHHSHLHLHEETEHDHRHTHTDHHQHDHESPEEIVRPHAHHHRHIPLAHDHPHVPELHHRHDH
ncbi:MAG: DMT family transporter, partial [Nitrospiraceae bacterium]